MSKDKKDIIDYDDIDDNENENDDKKKDIIENTDINLVLNSFEYYDKNNEKIKDKFINVKFISLEMKHNDLEHNNIIFYDKDLKELFKSRFERLGIFENKSQIWSWAWTISYFKKNETNIIRKILFYGTELDSSKSSFLKSELITSRFRITNKTQLDIHCAIASYLSKKPYIYSYKVFGNYELIDNKYLNILEPKYSYTKDEKDNYELTYYIFLLDL